MIVASRPPRPAIHHPRWGLHCLAQAVHGVANLLAAPPRGASQWISLRRFTQDADPHWFDPPMPDTCCLVLASCPPGAADALARTLVESGVAACVNVIPHLTSTYRWQGCVQRDAEALLLIKTARTRFEDLRRTVLAHHPYELPELIALDIAAAHMPYLDWILASTTLPRTPTP